MEGKPAEAHRTLEEALQAAQQIPTPAGRQMNVTMINNLLKLTEIAPK
jgi:hypothetical protein